MPKGPQGQKRPADVIARAVMVGRIATGELHEPEQRPRGAAGGMARKKVLTSAQRAEIAQAAANARWRKEGAI